VCVCVCVVSLSRLQKFSKELVPAVDCEWSSWGSFSDCSKSCGKGEQTRTRDIKTEAENGGKPCGNIFKESNDCNTQACGKQSKIFLAVTIVVVVVAKYCLSLFWSKYIRASFRKL